ncbi:hypothetical protein [Streptomyces mirabilis]|uniref:hypothetical protein n=1 Tax=Streptomyces mirabilis TaxID=68239 RepID=UPI0033E5DFD9
MASLVLLSERGEGLEWLLMESVTTEARLLASGFAEGRPGAGILQPTMSAVAEPGGLRVTGFKRACSLSRSMDLLTASIRVARLDGAGAGDQLAVAMITANSEGLSVSSFWGTFALAGAESDEVNSARPSHGNARIGAQPPDGMPKPAQPDLPVSLEDG